MSENIRKYLGIDWGEVRIGLAVGDSENKLATPFGVAKNIEEILAVVMSEKIDEIVIGEPLAMSNSELINKEKYLFFLEEIKDKTKLPVRTFDERLSSKAADALFGDKKNKASRDAVAAMLILQSFFDKA
jgi:putative holliday junction resolvase